MKNFLFCVSILCLTSSVWAETINLNDGRSVNGKILQKDAQSITVDVSGVTTTYYADEIKDIDGKALGAESAPVVTSTGSASVTAENPAKKRELILKFIEVFGTRKIMAQNFEAMITTIAQEKPDVAEQMRQRVKVDEIIERLIPLYDKHFTSEDLKTYIDFYSAPVGRKLIVNIGNVMKDSVDISSNYLKEKFPEMVQGE